MKPLALSSIRQQNLRKVLDLLTLTPAMTRLELSEAAGLSQMTVTNLVDLLKEQGVLQFKPIAREEKDRPAQGRKADAISLCGENKAWLIVDISNRQFTMTLMGFNMAPLLALHDDQQGEYIPRLEDFLRTSREKVLHALENRTLLGVAIVTPGPYEISSDTVNNQRLPQLNGVKVKELFRRCLGDYDYYVDEDVKFAVRAFSDKIISNQCEVLYYLYIGEGVGGAAVHGGNMLRGLNATAGDAGHLLGRGGFTFESRLSTEAFARTLGLEDSLTPEQQQEALHRLAEENPQRYDAALDDMASITAKMLHGVLWMLDPTHIIIDCVYARTREKQFIAAVEKHLTLHFAGETRLLPQIFPTAPGLSSVVRGAVCVLQRAWLERILM